MQAVVAFVRALCTVSREELENVKAPRMFSLTCLVQVAHFNMKRIRWGQTPHTR
jgi:brefeldin A-inhibited guanine nucleotide-exchange protein